MDKSSKAQLLAFGRRGRPRVVSEEIVTRGKRTDDRRSVEPAPGRSAPRIIAPEDEAPASEPELLQGPIILTTSTRDYHLENQVVLIGRSLSCDIQLIEETISKRHAILRVNDQAATIEDAGSTNGVYVGGVRIYRPHQLCDGQRIVIGSKVLTVFSRADSEGRATRAPESGNESLPPSPSLIPELSSGTTKREDALRTLGRLADKLLTMGRASEAERVLSDHLTKILGGARAGLPVPAMLRTHASKCALKLAESTHRPKWIDYCVELHLRSESPFHSELFLPFDRAVRAAGSLDRLLVGNYLSLLERLASPLVDLAQTDSAAAAELCLGHLDSVLRVYGLGS